ncbi:thiamine phosphate synthase [Paraburkholderia bonniea]|uniref:thiamine phosphate synthase n=1 Tax=Paraburkholderia bonniea TaxID=2152891 RepID=UPI00157FC6DF|nr:thiamine phosphate synthase [Paraburkholderia bonniea]WJF91847.1 thiamine phosphate synthase [Paraburkholderia bonniea]WJF95166.1 thiamine phosphate synthase [Paraburkholderia bonniea]
MSAIALPTLYLITPEPDLAQSGSGAFLERLSTALLRGIKLVQLRAKTMTPEAYALLAHAVAQRCHAHHANLILNGPALSHATLDSIGADGIHLGSRQLMAASARPRPLMRWVSAACHTPAELRHAEHLGLDFVTLSPVRPTATHPEAPALGWEAFATMASAARLPVFALGGMTPAHLTQAQSCGAHGIAAIRGLW